MSTSFSIQFFIDSLLDEPLIEKKMWRQSNVIESLSAENRKILLLGSRISNNWKS